MTLFNKTIATMGAILLSTTAFADPQEAGATASGDSHCDLLPGACDPVPGPHCDLLPGGCGAGQPQHWGLGSGPKYSPWSIFDPFLLDIPGGGKGMPVYSADDATKIIGYMKMPARPKPTGPVHCMIKETGLLAKSVDDCEAAGGTVAK